VHHGPETPAFLGWGAPGVARGTHRARRAEFLRGPRTGINTSG
jgi:hypothetical protein